MSNDITTQLHWKRTEEEKPPHGKWVWGLFVWPNGSEIEKVCRCSDLYRGKEQWKENGCVPTSDAPLLWSDPEDVIHSLMEVIGRTS